MMIKPARAVLATSLLMAALLIAPVADAQFGGGGGGGGGGRHGGGGSPPGGGQPPGGGAPGGARPAGLSNKPADQADIIGVVQSIDAASERVTIHYQPVDALDWPEGTKPFGVAKSALLNGVTVGEKVRFRLESQQIYMLQPFTPGQTSGPPPGPGVG